MSYKYNTIEKAYVNYVKQVIDEDTAHVKDDDLILEKIGNHIEICFNNQTLINPDLHLKLISKGAYDIEANPIQSNVLKGYVEEIKDTSNDKDFIYTYPNRLEEHFNINQFNNCVKRVKEDKGTNRSIMITLDPNIDYNQTHIPCLQSIQFLVRDDNLIVSVYFRSNDVFNAFYSNMHFIYHYALKFKDEISELLINTIKIQYHCSSAHIYAGDIEQANKMVELNKRSILL